MSKYIFSRCNKENLSTIPLTDGQIIYIKDTNELYFDIDNKRVNFDFIICVSTQDNITNPIEGKLYYIRDINALGIYSEKNLHIISSNKVNAEDVVYNDTSEIGTSTVQGIIDYLIANMEIDKDTLTQLSQTIEERKVEMKRYVDELVTNTKTEITEYVDNSVKVVKDNLEITNKNVSDLQEATKSLQSTCLGYGYKIEKIDTDVGFLKDKVNTAKTDINNNTESITKLEKKVTTNTENITKLEKKVTTNTESIETLNTLTSTHTEQISELNTKVDNNKTELDTHITNLENTKIDKEIATDTENKIVGKFIFIPEENGINLEQTILDVTTNISETINNKILSTNKDITITNKEGTFNLSVPKLETLETSIADVDGKLTTLKEGTTKQFETVQSSIENNTNKITELETNVNKNTKNISTNTQSIDTLNNTVNELENTVNTYDEKINTVTTKVDEFELEQQSQKQRMTVMETNIESNRITTKANTTAIEGIRNQIDSYHHYFRGYYKTSTEIQQLEGETGDYAYCGETQTIWVYTSVWGDSFDPIPNQVVPKTQTTPLMNGNASVGTEDSFAAGDHIHPTDVTRASEEDFQLFKTETNSNLENKVDKINETLLTESKDIVEAINELYNLIQGLKQ